MICASRAPSRTGQAHVLGQRQRRYQRQILMDEGKPERPCLVSAHGQRQISAEQPNASAGLRRMEPGQNLYQRRFARPIGAEKAVHLAAADREAHAVQREFPAEALGQVVDDQRVPGRSAGRGSRGRRCLVIERPRAS